MSTPASRTPVKSSVIRSIGYTPRALALTIEFVSGAVYTYLGVSGETHEAMLSAPSVGRYFADKIRPRYTPFRACRSCASIKDVGERLCGACGAAAGEADGLRAIGQPVAALDACLDCTGCLDDGEGAGSCTRVGPALVMAVAA